MKKIFLAFVVGLLLLGSSVRAQQFTSVQQIQYANVLTQFQAALTAAGIPVTSVRQAAGQAPSATSVTIIYDPAATNDQQTAGQALLNSFNFIPPPLPDVQGFEDQLWQDMTIPADAKLGLVGFFPQVEKYSVTRPFAIQQGWQAMLNSNPPLAWLTPDVITKTQNAANAYNVPLVAQPPTTP